MGAQYPLKGFWLFHVPSTPKVTRYDMFDHVKWEFQPLGDSIEGGVEWLSMKFMVIIINGWRRSLNVILQILQASQYLWKTCLITNKYTFENYP